MEAADGSFSVISRGSAFGEYEIDSAELPRRDDFGTRYMPAAVVDVGHAIFVNERLYISDGTEGVLQVERFEQRRFVDHDETGRFLIYAKRPGDPAALFSVDVGAESMTPVIEHGLLVDGFLVEALDPQPIDGYGDDGVAICRARWNTDYAIVTPTAAIAKAGDVLDGHTILKPDMPRRTSAGTFYFRDEVRVYRKGVADAARVARGPGDLVAGQPLVSVLHYSVNEQEQMAYMAALLGERQGVFLDDDPVAIQDVSRIDGSLVVQVGDNRLPDVSLNDGECVAFLARTEINPMSLYRACRVDLMDGNRDGFVDLQDYNGFWGCLTGPSETIGEECQVYDGNDDCRCDLEDLAVLQTFFDPAGP
jgi:hypothetical protein